ncbi:MAG: histidine phosphatase family protein [Magnetococcales bacterium]|nr:histidine phosphatase family protein [Magnetococcales bacterium]
MGRELIILRHAKSAWDTDAVTDFERPLAKRGLKSAPKMGKWMKKQSMHPDYIVSSPAKRAKQTVKLATKKMGIPKEQINLDMRIYHAGTDDLLEVLSETPPEAKRAMIVGHNPGLEFLFHYLVGGFPGGSFDAGAVKTATVVHLNMPDNWTDLKEGCAELNKVQHPREL